MNTEFKAFSGDVFLKEEFYHLIKKYDIKTVIETGTWYGDTTEELSTMVENVITIEASDTYYEYGKIRFSKFPNIHSFFGKSEEMIGSIWNEITKICKPNYLFFLDAHWGNPTPTPLELKVIKNLGIKPVIVIHDFFNPNHPQFGWDEYKDFSYKFENIEGLINDIYESNYEYYYNDQASGAMRGTIFIAPKEKETK